MNRGVTLTLGAVLILGDVIGAQADDLSGLVDVTPSAPALPSSIGLFPRLPENWSDLPVRVRASESVGYNSNVLGVPSNAPLLNGLSRGDFQSISTYGVSTSANWEGQLLFADATYGFTRYLHDVSLNSYQYALDAGVNWTYTSKCSGTLVASQSLASSPFGQQIASNAINSTTTTSLTGSGRCLVSGNYSGNFGAGLTESTNSTAANAPNNSSTIFVSTGVTYSVANTNSLGVSLTVTGTDFTNRSRTLNNLGLASSITQDSLNVTYARTINPNLSVVTSIGVVGSTNGAFSLAAPSGIVPQYSALVNWAATPKLSLSASVARSVSPPQAVVGNAQITESANFGLIYQISPKVGFSANASITNSSSAFTQTGGAVLAAAATGGAASQKTYSAGASLAYSITPFIVANLSYQFSRSVQPGLVTPQSTVMLNVNYNPH